MTTLFAIQTTIALPSSMAAACANRTKVKAKKQPLV
jgi:muconolactone delta-isomerase